MNEHAEAMAYLGAVYSGREISPQTWGVMLAELADLPADLVMDACRAHVRGSRSRWFPTPGEIRGIVLGAGLPSPAQAWRLAADAIDARSTAGLPGLVRQAFRSALGSPTWAEPSRANQRAFLAEYDRLVSARIIADTATTLALRADTEPAGIPTHPERPLGATGPLATS